MKPQEAAKLLEAVALRGFCSEPVTHWLNKDETDQYVVFTDEEKRALRQFLGENPHLAQLGQHAIPSFFGEGQGRKTISLLGRISYAMSGQHIGPDYVSGLAAELRESLNLNAGLWEARELESLL